MKTSSLFLLLPAILATFLAIGCSTPEARVRRNPEAFARLTPAQQEMIMRGEVGLSFDKEMVQLALGEPDRLLTRTDADGVSEVWSYTTYQGPNGVYLYRGWYHRYYSYRDPFYPYYLDVSSRRERERFRVVFRGERVVEIQQEHS